MIMPGKAIDNPDRDAQLRRAILNIARLNVDVYAHGYVPFTLMLTSAKDRDQRPAEDESHLASLIEHLTASGYLEESRGLGLDRPTPSQKHRRFRFTDFAFEWWRGKAPIDPMIDDQRLEAR